MRSIALSLLLVVSCFAIKCYNGTESHSKRFQSVPITEQPCLPYEVCGLGKHQRGDVKMCMSEKQCQIGNMKAFNTTVSLHCCGTDLCNDAFDDKEFSLVSAIAAVIISRLL